MVWSRQSPHSGSKAELAVEVARTEALFDSIGEAVIATDERGNINRVNDATLNMFGCKDEDLLGKKYFETVPAFDLNGKPIETLDRPIIRSLIEGKSISETIQYSRMNGTRFPVHVTVSPIMHEARPVGTIQVVRDVTREQEIDRAKTEFVSLASHQLRTPLTAMRWYLELLLNEKMGELSPEQRASIQEVYEVNLRLIELVGALLSVARIEIGSMAVSPELRDIKDLANEVVGELKPLISEKNINFTEDFDAEIPQMQLDPDLTRIIFQNTLGNAVKYTPAGGKVSLKIKREEHTVLITVADTGYGVPQHQQKMLFTKMFRADNARVNDTDGTGLGLYIVKSIVKNAKGKIWFKSKENAGSTFYVRLPLGGMKRKKGKVN